MATAAPAAAQSLTVEVLSSRPELVTGGDALIKVGGSAAAPTVTLNSADVSAAFATDSDGNWIGLVEGMVDGENTLVAGDVTQTLVNHPRNGTLIAGPQQQPFICENDVHKLAAPEDETCAAPTVVEYYYRDTALAWHPYDPNARANDIGMTTTTEGNTVPMIVRLEKGVINRAAYAFGILHDPNNDAEPTPVSRSPGWNGRLIYNYAGGLLAGYHMGNIIGAMDAAKAYVGGNQNQFFETGIERGYALASGSLNAFRVTTNDVVSAETTAKIKERFIEAYGPPLFTIGQGGSGGSMQQHLIANNYPGLLDGIFPRISYPDAVTFFWPLYDCDLMVNYFANAGDMGWSELQMNVVSGKKSFHYCPTNGVRYTDQNLRADVACDPVIEDAVTFGDIQQPRCTYQDNMVNIFGADPESGIARNPWDNTGVQYGLVALNDGIVSFDQFIDLNAKIGGHDADGNIVSERAEGDPEALRLVYATGRVNMGGAGLAGIPIIDYRGYTDGLCNSNVCPAEQNSRVDIHDGYHSKTMRERLIAANGNANNHVWLVAAEIDNRGIAAPLSVMTIDALDQMDRWLTGIVNDASNIPAAEKVARHRPADLVDACYTSATTKITDWEVCEQLFPTYGNARISAGAPTSDEIFKCQLKDVDAADYSFDPTPEQLDQIRAIFPDGVCDYSLAGVGQQELDGTWLQFSGDAQYVSLDADG